MKTESSRASEVLKSTRIMATLKRTEPVIKQKGIIVYPAAVRRSVAIVELHRQSGKFRSRRLGRPCPCTSEGFLFLRPLPGRLFSATGKVQLHRYSCVVSLGLSVQGYCPQCAERGNPRAAPPLVPRPRAAHLQSVMVLLMATCATMIVLSEHMRTKSR